MYKRAKMTAKAKDAVATYAAVHNISVSDVRTDRPAIRGIYAELEETGYVWQASKQSWAYIPPAPREKTSLIFSLSAEAEDYETAVYIITEGLTAAGYQVLSQTVILPVFDGAVASVIIEVKL